MQKVIIAAGFLLLGGCGGIFSSTDEAACRIDLEGGLRSPATLKIVETAKMDTQLSTDKFFKRYFREDESERVKLLRQIYGDKKLSVRSMVITYDADNAYGTPVRSLHACEFLLLDGKLANENMLLSEASSHANDDALKAALTTRGTNPDDLRMFEKRGDLNCCLPR